MDVRYGEEENAFLRLQEELVEKFQDESIFAWTMDSKVLDAAVSETPFGILAPWPSCFRECGIAIIDCPNLYRPRNGIDYTVARQGVQFEIPGRLPDHGNGVEWNSLIASADQGMTWDSTAGSKIGRIKAVSLSTCEKMTRADGGEPMSNM
jgi:hypothetical protein